MIASGEIANALQLTPPGDSALAGTRSRLLSYIGAETLKQQSASVVFCICMILSTLGDALDPAWIGEAGLDVVVFDLASEFSVLTMQNWHLQLLLGAAALAAGITVLAIGGAAFNRTLRPAPPRRGEKVPIKS